MRLDRSVPASARARSWLAAWSAAALLVLLIAAPAFAARGPVRLANPSVSPVTVAAGQAITFSVVYSNGQGNGPASIVVNVGPTAYPMSAPSGSANYGGGVTYTAVVRPPAGTWPVEFVATDKFGNVASLAGASATVVAPPPTPTPAPTPTPRPTPTPTQGPAPTPTPAGIVPPGGGSGGAGDPGTSGGGSGGGGGSGSGGDSVALPGGAGTDSAGTDSAGSAVEDGVAPWQSLRGPVLAFVQGGGDASGAGSGPDGLAGSSGGDLAGVAPGAALTSPFFDDWRSAGSNVLDASTGTRGGGLGAGSGTAALAATIAGLGHGIPLEQLLTTAVVTAGGVAMVMSFMLFGRRRRDDEPTGTDEALAASAAAGAGLVATGALLGGAVPAVAPARDAELDLPRWRRPSLLAARKEDPLRVARTDPRLTFDHGLVAPIEGVERRVIRYRLVRLLDSPDELVAAELGVLDEGDEVQLLKRSGPYWLVLSPDGRQGWIHRMVLGDVVRDDDTGLEVSLTPAAPAERRDAVVGPGGGMRLASEGGAAWSLQGAVATDAGMDIDDDVLRAYLESRRKV